MLEIPYYESMYLVQFLAVQTAHTKPLQKGDDQWQLKRGKQHLSKQFQN